MMTKIFNRDLYVRIYSSRIFRNFSSLSLSELIIRVAKFVVLAYAARILGPEGFGEFNYVLAFASLIAVVGDLGMTKILTRNLSQAGTADNISDYAQTILVQIIFLGILSTIATALFFIFGQGHLLVLFGLLIIFTVANIVGDYVWAFFRAWERMASEALVKTLQALMILVTGIWFLQIDPNPDWLGVSYALAATTSTIAAIFLLYRQQAFRLRLNYSWWFSLLKQSWPISIVAVSAFIFNQIDSVMLGYWNMFEEVGYYNSAAKLIGGLIIPAFLINQVFYPRMAKLVKKFDGGRQLLFYNIRLNALLYVPVAVVVWLFGGQIISLVFGDIYSQAHTAFIILSVGLFFSAMVFPLSNYLIVKNKIMINLYLSITAAVISVVLNIIFIPIFSYEGAAAATLITYIFLAVGYAIAVKKVLG